MANPLTPQGNLNKLSASVIYALFPQLNVTPSFLGSEMINLSFEGEATHIIETATGTVQSPQPYQMINLTLHLLRTQGLAQLYKLQFETTTFVGDLIVYPDVTTLSPYPLINCALTNVRPLTINGTDAGYMVSVRGYYLVNLGLWL